MPFKTVRIEIRIIDRFIRGVFWHKPCLYYSIEDEMENRDKHMKASVLLSPRISDSWWTKIGDVFLSRFSANYASFYGAKQRKSDEDMTVGYEAAWVGVARQVTKNNRIQ